MVKRRISAGLILVLALAMSAAVVTLGASRGAFIDITDATGSSFTTASAGCPVSTTYDFTGITSPSSTHTAEDGGIAVSDAVIEAGTFGARRDTIAGWLGDPGSTMHERTLVMQKITPADISQASSTTDTTTTSATDVAVSGMTLTPGAGDYLVWFSGSVEATAGGSTQNVSIYVDGAQVAHTERQILTEGSIPGTSFPVASHAFVSGVGAGQAIDVRWRTTSGTATMHERTLVVHKITPADISQASATTDTTTTSTTDVAVSGMTLTPGAGDYLVWFSGSVEATDLDTIQNVSIYVDGAQVAHTERQIFTEGSIPGTSFPVASQAFVTGVGAGQVIDVQWRTASGTATMHERTLVVHKITPADISQAGATTDTTTTSATDVAVSGMTLTPGAGDYLVWFSGSVESSTRDTTQNVSIYVDDAQVAHTERQILTEESIHDTSFLVASHALVTGVGAGQAIDVRWRTDSGWTEATTAEYTNLDGSDDAYYQGADPGTNDNAAMIFEFDIAENPGCITQIDVSVEAAQGGVPGADLLFVYLWDYATSSYLVGGSMNGNTDTVVSFSVTTDPGDYVQTSDGELTVFVVNEDLSNWIRVDDITVTVAGPVACIPGTTTYDFAGITSPSSTHTAEDGEIDETDAVIEAGTFGARRDTITGWANWAEATTGEYTNLDGSDNNYYQGADPGANDNAAMIFEFDVAEDPACITQIDVSVEAAMGGNPPAADFLFVYLWDYATSSYLVGGSMTDTTDTVVSFSVTTDPGDYVQTSDGQLTVFAVTEDVSDWIRIDDITVTVRVDPSAALSGTVIPSAAESEIVAGSETLLITLTNDTWAATVGDDNTITDDLISNIDSDGTEPFGWDAEVKGNMTFNDVVRTSATVVTITLAAESNYAITTDETITVTVPATAVGGASPIIATPTFDIAAGAGPPDLEQLHYRWRNDDGTEGAGPAPLQASATVDTAAETSTTDVLVPGMTLTPGAGDYLVSFSGSMENSSPPGTEADYVSLYVNGSQVAHTERRVSEDSSIPDTAIPVGFQALVTGVGAGETIEVRWRTTFGSIIMHERTLVAETITLADVSQATATTDTTTTSGTDVALAGMTLTPGAGDYLIWFSGSVENDAGNSTQNASLYVNGSQVAHTERAAVIEFSFIDTPLPVMFHALVTGVGAGEAIDVRWRTTGGGTATMHERTLVVQEITAADVSQASATADTPGETSTTDVLVPGMTLTPGAGDYLVWFTGSLDDLLPADDEIMNVSLYVNGAQVAHTERQTKNELSLDDIATTWPVMFQAFVTGVGAADTIEVRWRTDTGTMTMHERTLVVTKVTTAGGATWAADEDTALSGLTKSTTKRLRILISNAGAASGSVAYRLQVSNPNPVSCEDGGTSWTRIDTSTHWDMVTSTHFADGDPTSNIVPGLTDPGGGKTFFSGELQESPTDETSGIALSGTQFTEIEYAVEATASATDDAVYCFRLTDAGSATNFTYTETTYGKVTLAPAWYDTDWAYRSKITIDNTKVSGSANLAYFPVLINSTEADWADTANSGKVEQADGGDILFTASDGTTKLDHEIENYINTSGELVAWVELPDVSYNTDTDFWIYYGNSTGVADQWDISGTWDEGGSSNFTGVWHLKEDPSAAAPQFLNSVTASNDGTANSLSTSNQVPGQIDGSLLFDDTNERHVNVPHTASLQFATNMTVSAWVQTSDGETDTALIVNKWNTTTGMNYWLGKLDASDVAFYVDGTQNVTTALTDINDGTWHYVVGVADVANSLLRIYVDNAEKNTVAYDGTSETGTSDLHIGNATDALTQEWDGEIDETRVSDVARTAGWIFTEFNNQGTPGTFYQVFPFEGV